MPEKELKGVGGWLAWFTLGCFVSPLVLLGTTFSSWGALSDADFKTIVSLAPDFAFGKGYEMTGAVVISGSMLCLAGMLVGKHRHAARFAVLVLTVLPLYYGLDIALTALAKQHLHAALLQLGQAAASDDPSESVQTLRGMAWSLIWMLYFFKSVRVRNTFGPVTWRGVAQLLGGPA